MSNYYITFKIRLLILESQALVQAFLVVHIARLFSTGNFPDPDFLYFSEVFTEMF